MKLLLILKHIHYVLSRIVLVMSVYNNDIDQLLPGSVEKSVCKITRHIDHSKQGNAEETGTEREIMNSVKTDRHADEPEQVREMERGR